MKIIDLTLTYKNGMRGVALDAAKTLGKDGWNATTLHLYSHAGTHMDAPSHFLKNQATIEDIPLAACMGPAWIVDIPDCKPRQLITPGDLGKVRDAFREGESLLFRTLWSQWVDQPEYRNELPRISPELARWCVARKVKLLGVEPPSVADINMAQELTEVHSILLGGGVILVEGLCNLDEIAAERVEFFAIPLKYAKGDGAPARAFAILP
jgi:arylformamidase